MGVNWIHQGFSLGYRRIEGPGAAEYPSVASHFCYRFLPQVWRGRRYEILPADIQPYLYSHQVKHA